MKLKLTLAVAAVAAVALPTNAVAAPAAGQDRVNAARACTALQSAPPVGMGLALFRQTYGTNANDRNAFGKCVSQTTEAARQARLAAQTACRPASTRGQGNAFGRCVAAATAAAMTAHVHSTRNAAHECRAERAANPALFAQTYGTNANRANAFGKCVSSKRSAGGAPLAATLTGVVGGGTFAARVNLGQQRLCYTLTVTGLIGVTGASIHVKPAGTPVVLLAPPTTGTSTGCVTASRTLLQQILRNPSGYFVAVQTMAAPAGALAGDLTR
jgi:hypothetical protein